MTVPLTDPRYTAVDRAFMRLALGLAKRGLGRTRPNPAVGCILVRPDLNNRIVGRGWTQPGGRPHAETEALAQAGNLATGAEAFVTLEPCSHQGQTGPCADALIAAGVAGVTIAVTDPDPRVDGGGIEKLQNAGIKVRTGLLEDEAKALNAGFISVKTRGRPWVTMKTATTLDGRIAARTGASKWITNAAARTRGHLLRAQNDAIVTGIGTVLADDPELTCRIPGLEDRSPVRVVVDPKGDMPATSKLAQAGAICIVGTGVALDIENVETISLLSDANRHIDPRAILEALAERGITRVLLEAGAGLSTSFLDAGMVDEICWFRAPAIMGGDGLPAIETLGIDKPDSAPRFKRIETLSLDGDVLERYLLA